MTAPLLTRVARLPFASGFEPAQLRRLCATGRSAAYRPGERIFTEGGAADRFWLIENGRVALDLRVPGRGDQVIETLATGAVLGWSWLHPPYRWQFGCETRGPVDTVMFDAAAVRELCDADPAFGYAMLRRFVPVITGRLHATRLRLLDLYAAPAAKARP
ncbi:cyclic nucleotide-binding domain-containing protein [Actinoplanes sp. LDG1-06]|uniref:Cyclic nucleotide-binding domain-containing protein n=1 Tax=Paractinoplanes ovalisporus TaxID=2810368 RepID=A0ABS2A9B6_9ACTN|nr:cyclic nucleotide-binding domain-containing protein [Actinoplanes ovalisporus]MBM2616417.1 cyclic nucleotide-binding domain-containing protein [Actinoplanes ovalisporus]